MSTVASAGLSSTAGLRRRSVGRRKAADLVIKIFSWIAAWFGIGVMGFILYEVFIRGIAAINWDFFTKTTPMDATQTSGGGMANAIVGTLIITWAASIWRSSAATAASPPWFAWSPT